MPPFLASLLVLGLLVGLGIVAIVMIRSRWLHAGEDHGGWEKTLVDCKNLRDTGVLTEDEYRKIRTLVEPRTRIGMPDPSAGNRTDTGASGPVQKRN